MKEIKLTKGKIAIVDDENYEWLMKFKWHASKNKKDNTFYARRHNWENGRDHTIAMHREILGLITGDGKKTDHWNRNGLDNRKENLREVTCPVNGWNRKININTSSGLQGVYWHKRDQVWVASLRIGNGKRISCGCYKNPITAAKAWDAAAIKYRKTNAILNFPKEVNL